MKKGAVEAEKMIGIEERIERDVDYSASVIESISRSLYAIFSDLVRQFSSVGNCAHLFNF